MCSPEPRRPTLEWPLEFNTFVTMSLEPCTNQAARGRVRGAHGLPSARGDAQGPRSSCRGRIRVGIGTNPASFIGVRAPDKLSRHPGEGGLGCLRRRHHSAGLRRGLEQVEGKQQRGAPVYPTPSTPPPCSETRGWVLWTSFPRYPQQNPQLNTLDRGSSPKTRPVTFNVKSITLVSI